MDPEHPNASDMLLSKLTRFSLQGAGISHAGYACSSRARARVRSIGKIKRFLMRHEVDRVDVGHILAPAQLLGGDRAAVDAFENDVGLVDDDAEVG
jgi:hypothetical protein